MYPELYLSSNPGIQIIFILATKRNKYLRNNCMMSVCHVSGEKSVKSESRYLQLVVKGVYQGQYLMTHKMYHQIFL
jgi:hypothetical protein